MSMKFLSLDKIQFITDDNSTTTVNPTTGDVLAGPMEVDPNTTPTEEIDTGNDVGDTLLTIGKDMLILMIIGGIVFLAFLGYVAYKKRYESLIEEYASNPENLLQKQELTAKEKEHLEQWFFNKPGDNFLLDVNVTDEETKYGRYFRMHFQQASDQIRTVIPNKVIEKNKENCYFEFEIEEIEVGVDIVIGIGTLESYNKIELPGTKPGSIGFHSKGGQLFIDGKEVNAYALEAGFGETIGLGYNFETSRIYLFYNAKYLNEPPREFGSPSKSPTKTQSPPKEGEKQNKIDLEIEKKEYYPLIGATGPCKILLNIGGGPFTIHHKEIAKGLL